MASLNEIAARATIKINAVGFQHAGIGDSQRQRERQLLGFRPARVMDRTSIGQHKRTAKTPLDQPANHAGKRLFHFLPRGQGSAARGHGAERLIVDTQIDLGRVDTLSFNEPSEALASISPSDHWMKRERNPGIEDDAVKQPL